MGDHSGAGGISGGTQEPKTGVSRGRRTRSDSTGEADPSERRTRSDSTEEADPTGGGDKESGEGRPLCTRGPPTEELEPHPRVSEVVEETEEWDMDEGDYVDNLTFHEDSLSILRGSTDTPLGSDIPIWVTTDSGSMTQLIQSTYANRLKMKRHAIPSDRSFNINSPGGGMDEIEEYVIIPLRITCKQEVKSDEGYMDCDSGEEVITIKMKFGVCENLPVPVLWGGKQMRKYGLLDYHSNKTISLKVDGRRVITPSTSWMAATMEMRTEVTGKLHKAYHPFLPSLGRLSNMVMGGRRTINMPAILYPGRDNIVRVGRHNARVDEGYNEVLVTNREEFARIYGEWLVPIECVTNGEAHVIVRNNADQPVRLNPGTLELMVRPALSLPRIITPSEISRLRNEGDTDVNSTTSQAKTILRPGGTLGWDGDAVGERHSKPSPKVLSVLSENESQMEARLSAEGPNRFITWNLNGLATRMKKGDIQGPLLAKVGELVPDVIALQEVRLECEDDSPGMVKKGSTDEKCWEEFMAPYRERYDAYLSLSSRKYGGQAVLVSKSVRTPRVSYNMSKAPGHYKSGRFIRLDFPDLVVRSVYAPFNGAGKEGHHVRRREWDAQLLLEMEDPGPYSKARILLGDLNVVNNDSVISGSPEFWKKQGDQTVEEGDRGFGGTTENERRRFAEILCTGSMTDTFTAPLDPDSQPQFTFRGEGKFFGKGMKLDYVLADDPLVLSGGVESSEILSGVWSRDGFMGSDHAPLMCVLHPRWQKKRANLLAYYDSWERMDPGRYFSSLLVNSAAVEPAPGEPATPAKLSKAQLKGLSVPKPAEFPVGLWEYVDPAQRPKVSERYARYKSPAYLEECLSLIMTKLDIQPREEYFAPPWFEPGEDKPGLQENFLRAQALANPHIYFFPDPDEVAMAKDVVAEVVTTSERPFKCRPRKYSVVQQAFLTAKTNIMLHMKQLEDANSEWCHGLVLVAYEERIQAFMKKHGDAAMSKMFEKEHELEVATFFRLCVDLRMLNARTVPDRFPLPRIDDLLESVPRGCGRYSISDIADAFFKCELNKADRHKTAFKTHDRHLQFAVLPQGFINSPSVFCRLIARTFEGMRRECFSAYIDDVLNHTDEFQSHWDTQQNIYDRLAGAQLTLKMSKTHLNYDRVKFLGHILTAEGRLPDPEAVEAIREWANPTTTKEVRSFLGSTLYYREYIHGYSDMAMPLYDLIKKGVVVATEWRDEIHGTACQRIKDALTSKPVLMQVDNTRPFRLKVDACRVGRGIGSILEQQNQEGKWQPVSYYSCSLSKEERNYSATELECKALHDSILHYSVYLKYIPHFEVFSDHNALRYMVHSDNATTNGRLMRYLLALQEYNFAIYYRKGTENCDADAVSRLKRCSDKPVYLTEDELSQENGVVSKHLLERARALDRRNAKLEKAAKKTLSKLAKEELHEMATLNDHILAEGVENLESESGRTRFFENLQTHGLKCSRTQLDETLRQRLEDSGQAAGDAGTEEEQLLMLSAMVHQLENNGGYSPSLEEGEGRPLCTRGSLTSPDDDSDLEGREELLPELRGDPTRVCGMCQTSGDEEGSESSSGSGGSASGDIPRAEYGAGALSSRTEIPHLLTQLVNNVERELARIPRCELDEPGCVSEPITDTPFTSEGLKAMRECIKERVQGYARLALTASTYGLRTPKKSVDYREKGITVAHPNWKHSEGKILTSPINEKLVGAKKKGYNRMVVKESLIPGDTGWGLFASKHVREGEVCCTYEGVIVPVEHLRSGYGNKDYVAMAIKNHKTMEFICIDGQDETSCYGRFAQDPINEDLVNAKILWRKGQMVLVATCPISPGDEIYVHYGLDYWKDRLHFLDSESRERIEPRILKAMKNAEGMIKAVQFQGESTVAVYEEEDPPTLTPDGVREEGEPLQAPALDYHTRVGQYELQEGGESPEEELQQLDQTLLDELAYENVEECEDLAEQIQFLNGRKFEDEGRLYEIMQVRFDPEFGKVIGFRRPMSGRTPHPEDGSAFCVYGKGGLYELSELYLLHHPEDRQSVRWPANGAEWARAQAEDPELEDLIRKITDQGGGPLKEGRHKYALQSSQRGQGELLVRLVADTRKGSLVQAMVPKDLVKATLRMHHEGYGHMGSNRMLETIRLRYFWTNMAEDIVDHTGKCINCKLRKTYQRKPKVPIMKYDDTARPLDRVHVDLTGPLPLSKLKNRYIMVVKDYLTKYVWLIPLKTKTAVEVAEAFVGEFICQAGIPGRLVSDRGNEFVNQLLVNISRVMGINRVSTTPYNPRADGFVENHNKTLKDQLFHYVDNLKQDDWDVYLPTVQLMYNTTVSLATGYTPMLLLTGREARMPSLDHLAIEHSGLSRDVLNNAYVLKMIETMRGYQDFALGQTEKNKRRFNVRVKQPLEFVEYEVGQQFMRVRRPLSSFKSADEKEAWKITAKLLERYEGPYRITGKVNPVLYEAEIDGKVVRVHAVNMKPF